MSVTGLGDRAHLFLSMRMNTDIRRHLATKTQEMSTGVVGDLVAHLNGDTAPLADLDHRVALANAYGSAAREASNRLDLVQMALARTEKARSGLLNTLLSSRMESQQSTASVMARGAFEDIVLSLNTQVGSDGLFAGTATGVSALMPADAMMSDILSSMAGATTSSEVMSRLDTRFDDPTGGFATSAYKGTATDASRDIDAGSRVTMGVRADNATLRSLLKATAMGALAGDPSLGLSADSAAELLQGSRDSLLSLSAPLTNLQADIGMAQSRVEEAVARHTAKSSAWTIMRNEMAEADPYSTASEVKALQTQLETHYEITQRLSSLNLMSYLR